jgi:hypothetical protein
MLGGTTKCGRLHRIAEDREVPEMGISKHWWAKGTLFENCNCRPLCHGVVSYRDKCDFERCLGIMGIHIAEGEFGDISLGGVNAVVFVDAPQLMISGGWTQAIYIDERADMRQREALETILSGQVGGGWSVLGSFVETRLDTLYVPIQITDNGRHKAIKIGGVVETEISAIKGADKQHEVTLQNIRNQVFDSPIVLAMGQTQFHHRGWEWITDSSHAMYSDFSWKGP